MNTMPRTPYTGLIAALLLLLAALPVRAEDPLKPELAYH